jgi:DNA-binding transcriptional LysR family regulator
VPDKRPQVHSEARADFFCAADDLAAGRLVELFPQHDVRIEDARTGVWMLYPSRSYVPAKVRVFIEFMRAAVGAG